jgi:hypothetical protein
MDTIRANWSFLLADPKQEIGAIGTQQKALDSGRYSSGYFEFLRVLLTPEPDEAEEQRHMKRWSGERFDPEHFDLAKTDNAVRNAPRRALS